MPHYFQNFKKIYNKVVQLIKEPVNALELLNYKYKIIKLKIHKAISLINLSSQLNLGRDYILAHLINSLINLA